MSTDDNALYELCKNCDHFIENGTHLCDELHHDPDDECIAEGRGETQTLAWWKINRPDLFVEHDDGLIGPNSEFHETKLDVKPSWEGRPFTGDKE